MLLFVSYRSRFASLFVTPLVFPRTLPFRIQLTVRLPKELMICQVTASAFPVTYVSPRELPATPGSRLVDGQRNCERCSGSGPAAGAR